MSLTVAKIGRAHGLRGEVALTLRTDAPHDRFYPGAVLQTIPADAGPLTVEYVRNAGAKWWAAFEEIQDRTQAEAMTNVQLLADDSRSDEEDAWYEHELKGLEAFRPNGEKLGVIEGLQAGSAQDILILKEPSGARSLIPFVKAIVPVVDIEGGRIEMDPPYGLLDGEVQESTDETKGES